MNKCEVCNEQESSRTVPVGYMPGDTIAFAAALKVCDLCAGLLVSRDAPRIAARLSSAYDDWPRSEVAELLLKRVSRVAPSESISGEERKLFDSGFERLELHTGIVEEFGPLWPSDHVVTLPDFRADPTTNDLMLWLVRSPWAALSVSEVIWVLTNQIEQDSIPSLEFTRHVREVFDWSESKVVHELSLDPPAP